MDTLSIVKYLTQPKFHASEADGLLAALGWSIDNPDFVFCEKRIEDQDCIFYFLCLQPKVPFALFSISCSGNVCDFSSSQLIRLAHEKECQYAIHTDGEKWNLHYVGRQFMCATHLFFEFDRTQDNIGLCVQTLERYASRKYIDSDMSLSCAVNILKTKTHLPKLWEHLNGIHSPSMLRKMELEELIRTLSDEFLQQYKFPPDGKVINQFVEKSRDDDSYTLILNGDEVSFRGELKSVRSAIGKLKQVYICLDGYDGKFLDRFSSMHRGRSRRYLTKDKYDLYPGRPDLSEKFSQPLSASSDWWMSTNHSKNEIYSIIQSACECAGVEYRKGQR